MEGAHGIIGSDEEAWPKGVETSGSVSAESSTQPLYNVVAGLGAAAPPRNTPPNHVQPTAGTSNPNGP